MFTVCIAGFSQKSLKKVYAAPNPFATSTKIHIESTQKQTVYLNVKNVLGRTVYSKKIKLVKGQNTVPFAKNQLRSGMYIYALRNKKETVSKRLIIR